MIFFYYSYLLSSILHVTIIPYVVSPTHFLLLWDIFLTSFLIFHIQLMSTVSSQHCAFTCFLLLINSQVSSPIQSACPFIWTYDANSNVSLFRLTSYCFNYYILCFWRVGLFANWWIILKSIDPFLRFIKKMFNSILYY